MARQWNLNGATLVEVRGGCHMSGGPIGVISELGLSTEQITVSPEFNFRPVNVNDWGPDVPADVLWMLSSVKIQMTLIHYDPEVLDICVAEVMGGSNLNNRLDIIRPPQDPDVIVANLQTIGGTLGPAGQYLGGLKRIYDSGWHYVSVNLTNEYDPLKPYTFPKCYLKQSPVEIPLGTKLSAVKMEWTALPYYDPLVSGSSGLGEPVMGLPPYPDMNSGAPVTNSWTYRGDVPSSGSVLWTRFGIPTEYVIPMNP